VVVLTLEAVAEALLLGSKAGVDPEAVRWLANELALYGRSLAGGDVVITGAPAAAHKANPGRIVAGPSALFGAVSVVLR
jgi:2-keto-4-pentenoate hydratase